MAVRTMKKGEEVALTVNPQYGFGETGKPADGDKSAIPANAILDIKLELISWKTVVEVTEDKMVIKKILKEGEGYKRPKDGADVKLKVTCKLEDGTVFFRKGHGGDEAELFEFTTDEGDGNYVKVKIRVLRTVKVLSISKFRSKRLARREFVLAQCSKFMKETQADFKKVINNSSRWSSLCNLLKDENYIALELQSFSVEAVPTLCFPSSRGTLVWDYFLLSPLLVPLPLDLAFFFVGVFFM